jgi:hypothetical protein
MRTRTSLCFLLLTASLAFCHSALAVQYTLDQERAFETKSFTAPVTAVALSRTSRFFAAGLSSGEVAVFSMQRESATPEGTYRIHAGPVVSVSFAPSDGTVVSCGGTTVAAWERSTGRVLWEAQVGKGASCVTLSPNGKVVACGAVGTMTLYAASSGRVIGTIKGFGGKVVGAGFDKFMKHLVFVASDATIRTWDIDAMQETRCAKFDYFGKPIREVRSASISPDGRRIAIGCFVTIIQMGFGGIKEIEWINLFDGDAMKIKSFGDMWKEVSRELALSNNAGVMASLGQKNQVRIWDVEGGSVVANCQNCQGLSHLAIGEGAEGMWLLAGGGTRVCGWGLKTIGGSAAPGPIVAVLDPKLDSGVGGDAPQALVNMMSDVVRQEVHDSGKYSVMTTTHLAELIGMDRVLSLINNPTQVAEEPKLQLEAPYLVASRLTKVDTTYNYTVTILNSANGRELNAASETMTDIKPDDVVFLARRAAGKLVGTYMPVR